MLGLLDMIMRYINELTVFTRQKRHSSVRGGGRGRETESMKKFEVVVSSVTVIRLPNLNDRPLLFFPHRSKLYYEIDKFEEGLTTPELTKIKNNL